MLKAKLRRFIQYFWKIPFLVPYWNAEEFKVIARAIFSGKVVKGSDRELFVQRFYNLIGAKHGIATNLARSAIELALRGMELKKGDEVILPAFGCKGTIVPVINAGCTPVLVDIEQDFNISPESVRKHITDKTRAVIVPHLSGKAAKVKEIREAIKGKNIFLIEDAAQATGAWLDRKYLGLFGDVGVFSFGMGKNIMAAGGGIVVTDSEDLYRGMKNIELGEEKWFDVLTKVKFYVMTMSLRKYTAPYFLILNRISSRLSFLKPRFFEKYYGNYKLLNMSNLDASILLIQLRKLSEIIEKRRGNAKILSEAFSDIKEVIAPKFDDEHIFTKFIITFREATRPQDLGLCREANEFIRFLIQRGIEAEGTYIPLHLREGFRQYADDGLAISEDLYWRSFALPVQPNLTEKDMNYFTKALREYFGKGRR